MTGTPLLIVETQASLLGLPASVDTVNSPAKLISRFL